MKLAASDAMKLTACAISSRAWRSKGTTPGATALTVIPSGASSRAQLRVRPLWRALRGRVGGPAGRRPVPGLGVDLHDAARSPRRHAGEQRAPEHDRALDEALELHDVVLPRHQRERRRGLRAGRVEHQHLDRAQAVGDRGGELGRLALVRDVPGERLGHPAVAADGVDDLEGQIRIAAVVDGHGQAIAGQTARDGPAGTAGAPGDEGDAPPRRARTGASWGSASRHFNDRRVEHRSKVVSGVPSRPTMRAGAPP